MLKLDKVIGQFWIAVGAIGMGVEMEGSAGGVVDGIVSAIGVGVAVATGAGVVGDVREVGSSTGNG